MISYVMNPHRRRWRSRPVATNCFWWVCRQYARRRGYITLRRIDVALGPLVSRTLAVLALACFVTDPFWLWPIGIVVALHAPLFCFHWGWMPKHRRRLYHFRPANAATQVPSILPRGYIQLGEDDEH